MKVVSRHVLIEYLLPALLIAGGFLLLFSSSLNAQLDLIDDHELIDFAALGHEHPQIPGIDNPWGLLRLDGRYRMVYYGIRIGGAQLWGSDPLIWHVLNLACGVFALILFYRAARKLSVDSISSAFFLFWIVATEGASETWTRVGPSETYGIFFLALALWAFVRAAQTEGISRWDALGLVSLGLSGWCKESFVLAAPVLLFGRYAFAALWFHRWGVRDGLRRLWLPLLIGGGIFVVQFMMALSTLRPGTYAAHVVGGSIQVDPTNWYQQFAALASIAAYYVPALVLFGIVLPWRGVRDWRIALVPLAFAVWMIPQFMLTPSGIAGSRYAYPAIIGLAALNTFALAAMRRWKRGVIFGAVAIWAVLTLARPLVSVYNSAQAFDARTQVLHQMVTTLADSVPPDQVVVIAANPAAYYEATLSLVSHLGLAGMRSPVYLYSTIPVPTGDDENSQIARLLLQMPTFADYHDVSQLSESDVGAIILLPDMDSLLAYPPAWFDPHQWAEQTFSQPVMVISKTGLRQDGEVTYHVLRPASTMPDAPPLS